MFRNVKNCSLVALVVCSIALTNPMLVSAEETDVAAMSSEVTADLDVLNDPENCKWHEKWYFRMLAVLVAWNAIDTADTPGERPDGIIGKAAVEAMIKNCETGVSVCSPDLLFMLKWMNKLWFTREILGDNYPLLKKGYMIDEVNRAAADILNEPCPIASKNLFSQTIAVCGSGF